MPAGAARRGVRRLPPSPRPAPGLPGDRWRSSPAAARAPRPSTSPRSCAAPTCATAWPGPRWPCWCGPAGPMIPGLTRALVAAGVPVEVAGDEIPLAADPAVRPLLLGLQVAARGARSRPTRPRSCSAPPLGGMDSMAVRRLGRALRDAERARAGRHRAAATVRRADQPGAAPSRPAGRVPGDRPEVDAARRLAELLHRACARGIRGGSTAEEALWLLWSGTDWPDRLRREAARGGEVRPPGQPGPGRRSARCSTSRPALEEVSGRRGVTAFLAEVESQQIPADPMRESELRGSAVRVLTAHRAKGLEWELVVVAGVQEGAWPDVRRRGSLLEPDRLGRHEVTAPVPTASRIAEERRLFYVACTRARIAAGGDRGGGDRGGGRPAVPVPGRARRAGPATTRAGRAGRCPCRPWSASSAGSASTRRRRRSLREQAADPAGPAGRRHCDDDGRPLVAAARPEQLVGACVRSASRRSRWWRRSEPVRLSGSQLAGVLACPRQWFLSRQAHGGVGPQHRGQLRLGGPRARRARCPHRRRSGRAHRAPRLGLAPARLRRQLAVGGGAGGGRVRPGTLRDLAGGADRARAARHRGRRSPASSIWARSGIQLTGSADRVERDPDGRIRIVDFKTVQDRADRRRRRAARPARGLPAGGAAGGASPPWPGRAPGRPAPSWSTCGCPTAPPAIPRSSAGLPGRRALPVERPPEPDPTVDSAGDLGAPPAGRGGRAHPLRAARRPGRPELPLLPVPRQLSGAADRSAGGPMTHVLHVGDPLEPPPRAR